MKGNNRSGKRKSSGAAISDCIIPAQMVYDVQLALKERCPVDTCLRSGGNLIERDDIIRKVHEILNGGAK